MRAKEGGKETTPAVCTLPMVPCGVSPVTRFALASAMRKTKHLRRRLTLFHVHRSRWWGKTPHHKTGPLRKWFKQFQHLENNSSKSRDTGTTFKHLNILQRWKWVLSSCKIRLEFRCSLGSALVQSTSRKERRLVSPTGASNRAYRKSAPRKRRDNRAIYTRKNKTRLK